MGERSSRQQLPLDIIHDILLRLPVKPLHRFLSVSKPWYSLISDPSFKKTYHHRRSNQNPLLLLIPDPSFKKTYRRRRSNQNPLLLLTKNEDDANGTDTHLIFSTYNDHGSLLNKFSKIVPAHPPPTRFQPFQSCLGLVCMGFFYNKPIMVCNPATEEMVTLPKSPVQGYDQCIGFGYAASTEEFKVVRFFQREAYQEYSCCEVFALGGIDGWRKARKPPPYMPRWGAPLLNGALHLMPLQNYGVQEDRYLAVFDAYYETYERRPYVIAAFDVDTEEYREVPLPEIYFSEGARLHCSDRILFAELGGSLCLTFDFFRTEKSLEVWLLKDYDNGIWVKGYTIDLSFQGSNVWASPIAIMGNGNIWVSVYLANYGESVLRRYNTEDSCFEENMGTNFLVMPYVESFLPLNKKENSRRGSHDNTLLLVTQKEDDANGFDSHLLFSTYNDEGSFLNKFCKTVSAEPGSSFELFQSCLGLVCLGFFYNKPILICNPSTEELITVPKPPVQGYDHCIGFGYAALTKEFKVVRFFMHEAYHEYSCCEVFTLGGSAGLRKVRNPPPYKPRWGAPLLHGALHSMPSEDYGVQEDRYLAVFDSYYETYERRPYVIAAFDVDTEEYREVPLPEIYFSEAARLRCSDRILFAELRGSLCLTFDFFRTDKYLELWLLKDYENGIWVKEYTIDLSLLVSEVWATPLAVMGDGSILLSVYLVDDEESELRRYDTEDNCFAEKMGTNCLAIPYVRSFLPAGK